MLKKTANNSGIMNQLKEETEKVTTQSPTDRLAGLASMAPKLEPKAKSKSERPIIQLSDQEQDVLNEFLASTMVNKDVEAKKKALYAIVRPMLAKKYLFGWQALGTKPDNPRVPSDRGSCLLEAKDKTGKFSLPEGNEDFQTYLVSMGVPKVTAKQIATKEVETKTVYDVASPSDLEETNPELANKLVSAIIDSGKFTQQEIKELITARQEVSLREGFLGRLVTYLPGPDGAEERVTILDRLITAIKCVEYSIASVKWDGSLDEAYDSIRTANSRQEIMDVATGDGLYRLTADGVTARIFKNKKLVCEKQCKDNGHALNTVKKWQRDRQSLEASIAEYQG
jgi:chorismate mutase